MNKTNKWTAYVWICILLFCAFLLEYFSIFVIEMMILKMDISNYTANDQSIHHLIMVALWILYIGGILFYSKKKFDFPRIEYHKPPSLKSYGIAILCLLGCKVMTYIDWHTLKVIGEMQSKDAFQFIAQYMYYFAEVIIVVLIIMFGQKAFEIKTRRERDIPFGGIVLACTWGIFHFISRGVGIEIWNGISCMIFSILSGIMYIKLGRRYGWSYVFIAIGYLL